MGATPQYIVTPRIWAGTVPTSADTSFSAPSNVTSLATGGAGGSKVLEVDVTPTGTVVAGLVNFFLYDGTHYRLVPNGSLTIAAYTSSTTVAPPTVQQLFDNLVLPSSSWSLVCSSTIASQPVTATAIGGDF